MARTRTRKPSVTYRRPPKNRFPALARGWARHPETSQPAPKGQHWVRNARFGGWQLESVDTPFSCSVSSEAYWSA